MGAVFICGVLAIKMGNNPKFNAAKNVIDNMSENRLKCLVENYLCEFSQEKEEINLVKAKEALYEALEIIKSAWEGQQREFSMFDHIPLNATLLITGERSYGDPVEEVNIMVLFEASGMAEAAGFLV